MARLISPKYFIILGIVVGFVFLTHTSLSAQGTSDASRDREKFAQDMVYRQQILGECKESQSRLKSNRSDLETFYQKYLESLEEERNADAARGKAQSELEAAESALESARKEYDSKNKKCERLKRVNPHLDYTKIPECVDAANFLLLVVDARKETHKKKIEDFAQKGDLHQECIEAREGSFSDYILEVHKSFSHGISSLMMGYGKEPGRKPNEWINQLDGHCKKLQSDWEQSIKRAAQITASLVKDCKFGEADRFVASLPDYKEKADLAKPISDARKREDDAAKKYEEGRKYYREGQIEERAGRIAKAGDLYRSAIANLQEARAISKCDSRIAQFDKAILTLNTALARLATAYSEDPRYQILGTWDWFNGAKVTIAGGGFTVNTGQSGTWTCTNLKERKFRLTWSKHEKLGGPWYDDLTLSPNGKMLAGQNQIGTHVWGNKK